MTASAGASLTWSEFYPYGAVRLGGIGAGAPAANPFAFTGEQRDGLTGLYHLRARQYDPGTGRFLTTDPLAPLIGDPYVASYGYARNNPTALRDPSGLAGDEFEPAGLVHHGVTFGICGNLSGGVGYQSSLVGCFVLVDVFGDIKLVDLLTGELGAEAVGSANAATGIVVSNAGEPEDLANYFNTVGLSGGEVVTGGGDFSWGPRDAVGNFVWTLEGWLGLGLSVPAVEGHGGVSATQVRVLLGD